jgi:hypothetical protein
MHEGTEVDGPFCSGTMWVLDEDKNPKLLVVGGHDYETSPVQDNHGTPAVCWFNPLETPPTIPAQPAIPPSWFDGPAELPDQLWYPSIGRYLSSPTSFSVLVVGGSSHQGFGCGGTAPDPIWQYSRHWTLDDLENGAWAIRNDAYLWHQYPRTLTMYDGGAGSVLTIGHAVICESPVGGSGNPFGGAPLHRITGSGATVVEVDSPNPGTPPEPVNPTTYPVGGWHYTNAALLHTLKPQYRVPQTTFPAAAHTAPETIWNLDRLIVNGGAPENNNPALPDQLVVPALGTWEWTPTLGWTEKAPDPTPRAFGNLVILPNGSLLAVGGQAHTTPEGGWQERTQYRFGSHRFEPGLPGSPGIWTSMQDRTNLGPAPSNVNFEGVYGNLDFSMPRGYHSVAVLLKSGDVALMGGEITTFNSTIPPEGYDPSFLTSFFPEDSIEVYKPPFAFESQRPRVTSPEPLADMHYGVEYCIQVNDSNKVDYACLIGVGSATHHFDYGQRYIELMVKRGACSGGNLTILPPTKPAMAPEGYFLLFVVQKRQNINNETVLVPSAGAFVKVTF